MHVKNWKISSNSFNTSLAHRHWLSRKLSPISIKTKNQNYSLPSFHVQSTFWFIKAEFGFSTSHHLRHLISSIFIFHSPSTTSDITPWIEETLSNHSGLAKIFRKQNFRFTVSNLLESNSQSAKITHPLFRVDSILSFTTSVLSNAVIYSS